MRKPFHIYHEQMRHEHKFLALPAWTYKIVWPILIALDISSLFLYFSYNYEACAQTFYIVATAFALATLVGYMLWPVLFIKWGSATGGFLTLAWSFGCASVVFGMIVASILNTGCPVISSTYPTGAIAAAFWGVQLVWLIMQMYTAWRWMWLPKRHRDYRVWLWQHKELVAIKIRDMLERKYGLNASNGYGMSDDSGSWEADERVDAGDSWSDVMKPIAANAATPLIRKTVIKGD
jgi:hypothetical protein